MAAAMITTIRITLPHPLFVAENGLTTVVDNGNDTRKPQGLKQKQALARRAHRRRSAGLGLAGDFG